MEFDDSGNATYFESYEDLKIHELMLTDQPRQDAYQRAILGNRKLFQGKTVLDVGAGTGILSVFCAQAGAAKVYAVEASNLARLAREVVAENGYEAIVEVVESKIEDFHLPDTADRVDIIVSEWMGFFLLHEGMLDSVIDARDRLLKPNGLMFPETATLYVAPCAVPSRFDRWESLSGVSMKSFGRELRRQGSDKPEVLTVAPGDLLHEGHIVTWLDLKDATMDSLESVEAKEVLVLQKSGKLQGFCIWFDCSFPSDSSGVGNIMDEVVLSTNPNATETHWKQTVIPLPEDACEELEERDPVAFRLAMQRNTDNRRRYNLQLTLLDADKEEHSLPCECQLTRCILMKAHLEKMQMEN